MQLNHRTQAQVLARLVASVTLGLGLWQAFGPVQALVDRFMPDDAFYYMQPARVFTETGQISFDGQNPTNGFHPLWFLVNAAVYAVFPGESLPFRVLMILQSLLTTAAFGLLAWHTTRTMSAISGAIVTAICLIAVQRIALGGLETSLLLLCWTLLWINWPSLIRSEQDRGWRLVLNGSLAGFTILARLDSIFLVGLLALHLFSRTARQPVARIRRLFWFLLPVATCLGPYLLLNWISTGHLQPVSGSVKSWIGASLRMATLTDGLTLAELGNHLFWFLSEPSKYFIAAGLLTPWIAIYIYRHDTGKSGRVLRAAWPFAAAASVAWLYYTFSYWGPLARAPWYYTPHAVLAGISCAAIGQVLSKKLQLPGGAEANLAGILLVTPLLGWVSWPVVGITLGLISVATVLSAPALSTSVKRAFNLERRWVQLTLGILTLLAIGFAVQREFDAASWALAGTIGILITSMSSPTYPRRLVFTAAVLIAGVGLRSGLTLHERLQPSAPTWNGLLYEGALWAREHLPSDARIWANDAGVLGYFSQRPVTNTDGLINSFDFFEQVLQTRQLEAYCEDFDYHIACNTAEQDLALQAAYPSGYFLDLPPALASPRFETPRGQRHLIVFVMPRQAAVVLSTQR